VNISVRAFAVYREAIGAKQVALDVASGATAGQVWDVLRGRYPTLGRLPRPFAFAINDTYVPPETVLRERDELVLSECARRGIPVAGTLGGGYAADPADTVDIHFGTAMAFRERGPGQ